MLSSPHYTWSHSATYIVFIENLEDEWRKLRRVSLGEELLVNFDESLKHTEKQN